jgi:hypothetical protein
MISIISEARKTVHASRSKIATSTGGYEQQLRAWYQAYENLKAKHEATTAKLREDYHSLNRQLEIARDSIKATEWEVQRMTKGHKIALKNAEDRTEIAEKKLFDLKKEKPWEHRGVMAAAEVLGGVAAPENEKSVQLQDHLDSLISSREQRSQGLDDGRQIPQTKEFVQISSTSPLKIISAPISKKRPRSESGRDMDAQKRNRKARREEGASEKFDEGTIVVKQDLSLRDATHLLL